MPKSSQFHIQLDGVNLTAAQTKALASDLDKLVSSHLAKTDARGDYHVGRPLILNPEWLGIWIRNRRLNDLVDSKTADIPKTLNGLKQDVG